MRHRLATEFGLLTTTRLATDHGGSKRSIQPVEFTCVLIGPITDR